MKRFLAFFFFLYITSLPFLHAQSPADNIVGSYYAKLSHNDAKVKVFKYKDGYRMQIYWLKNPKNADGTIKTDQKNPDRIKRDTPMSSVVLIDKVTYKNGLWQGGRIYDPSSGKSYKVELNLMKTGQLEVKGILGIFHKCMYWERLD